MSTALIVMAVLAAIGPILGYRLGRTIAERVFAGICAGAMAKCLRLDVLDNVEGAVWAIAEVWSDATESPVQWLDAARERVGYLPARPTHPGERT